MADLDEDLAALAKACAETDPETELGIEHDPWWRLSELTDDEPDLALAVVVQIAALTEDMHVLSVLGAGPVEDLLIKHPATLDGILLEARRSPNFRKAFRCIWTSGMSQAVKAKVDEALKAYGGNL
jgi:hypothetical protein